MARSWTLVPTAEPRSVGRGGMHSPPTSTPHHAREPCLGPHKAPRGRDHQRRPEAGGLGEESSLGGARELQQVRHAVGRGPSNIMDSAVSLTCNMQPIDLV